MSVPTPRQSTRRQLPREATCQCHALLSYKPKPKLVYRPEEPRECVEELCDEVFRMSAAILLRLGIPLPPAEIAYFEHINEVDFPHDATSRHHPVTSCPEHDSPALADHRSQEDLRRPENLREPGSELKDLSINSNAKETTSIGQSSQSSSPQPLSELLCLDGQLPLLAQDQPQSRNELEASPDAQPMPKPEPRGNPIVRYITEDQLKTMGWKDLFKLARVRGVFHGPMMRNRQELVAQFAQKFGGQVPIHQDDKIPDDFPSKRAPIRLFCDHPRSKHHRGPMLRRGVRP